MGRGGGLGGGWGVVDEGGRELQRVQLLELTA